MSTDIANQPPLPPLHLPKLENFTLVFSKQMENPTDLSHNEIEYIKYLVNDTAAFTNIENAIKEIMRDGKVDFHDIPQIIVAISNIVSLNYIDIYKKIDKIAVIKYIINQIIDSGLLPLPAIELPIIKRIIDSSIDLLEMNLNSNWWSKCFSLFSCCCPKKN